MSNELKEIRSKKLKDQTREELTLNRKYTLELIKNTHNPLTLKQECKYLEKIENEILRRNTLLDRGKK